MTTPGLELMSRPKSKPKAQEPIPESRDSRVTIINLKGSPEQGQWLESVHRKTHIAKSVIVRLALSQWAASNGHPPFPTAEDDQS
jgi:hypothetical protein